MRFRPTRFAVATRFTLLEHSRNRFAMILVIVFVPVWTTLAYLAMPDTPRGCGYAPPGRRWPRMVMN
ncbi:integral membrane protein [Streptomyces griseus]|uniref:Integral membrane protein n=1 Tax=Streptomyces griseus TaxID=1911 RepID=A0A380P9I2_STRGR|nr:integral membrane protein [Streptomyces griseus]